MNLDRARGLTVLFPALVDSFRLGPESTLSLLGLTYGINDPRVFNSPNHRLVQDRLTEILYSLLHSKRRDEPMGLHDPVATRDLIQRLSSANCGTGPWQTGWLLHGSRADGTLEVENYGLKWRIPAAQFRPEEGKENKRGLVRVGKEYRELAGGYYMCLGDAVDDPGAAVFRIYWHVSVTGAEHLVEKVTRTFNSAQIPFRFKVLKVPEAYHRTDSAVLYVPRPCYLHAAPLIAEIWRQVRQYLSPSVSLFVKRIAPGVGIAEDPSPGVSFGIHRSQILAAALMHGEVYRPQRLAQRVDIFQSKLIELGLDPDRPYLMPGSRDIYLPIAS